MKKFFFSVAALAAALSFTACSDDVLANDPYAAEGNWTEEGLGYMTLNIQLPTKDATRANDSFADGLETEYAVNKAILVIFGSDTDDEKNAAFASAYTLGDVDPSGVGTAVDNITNHRKYTTQITRMGGTYAWAMVILNPGDLITENSHSLSVNGANFTGTVEDLQKTLVAGLDNDASKFHKDGFLMLNAPLWKSQGGSSSTAPGTADLYYLSRIDRTKIFGTLEEATKGAPATVVNVERAVAKVTMQEANGSIKEVKDGDVVTNPTIKGLKWQVLGWELDNTNKSSYLLRNMTNYKKEGAHESGWEEWTQYYSRGVAQGTVDHFRFVGANQVKCDAMPEIPALYRTYFAIDPNYVSYNSLESFNRYENATGEAGWNDSKFSTSFGNEHPKYCGENTFNLANQIWGATTRVVLKVQLGEPVEGVYPTFYTLEENGASAMYTAEGIGTLAATQLLGTYRSEIESAKQIKSLAGTPVKVTYSGKDASGNDVFTTAWANSDGNKVEFRDKEELAIYDNTNWGIANGSKYTCYGYGSEDWNKVRDANNDLAFDTEAKAKEAGWKTASDETTWDFDYLNANYKYTSGIGTITVFQNGIAYYETRIKHFGDSGCPWRTNAAWETPQPSVSVGAYPGDNAEANYLGRWGVLRNNWYDLTVTGISKIGSPVPPELKKNESNTDDELEQFISVDVNILSWAKRTQSVEL